MSREQHLIFLYNQKDPSTPCEGNKISDNFLKMSLKEIEV